MKFLFFAIFVLLQKYSEVQSQGQKCAPVSPVIDPNLLPKLSDEFQTRVSMTINEKIRVEDAVILFDRNARKSEIIFHNADNKISRLIYYFDKDEIFTIENDNCTAKRITTDTENFFFGMDTSGGQLNMKPPTYFLRFNNGYPHKKLEPTTWRGIPVNHYQSCQDEFNGNFLIDYYFSIPDYQQAVTYPTGFTEIPVAAVIEGFVTNNPNSIKHEYNFYEFRTFVERKTDLYVLPPGLFCDGMIYKEDPPTVPPTFSYTQEIIFDGFRQNGGRTININYASKLEAIRIDEEEFGRNGARSVKIIEDYNSGLVYEINKETGNYSIYGLLDDRRSGDQFGISVVDNQKLTRIRTPNEYFRLDENLYPVGERYERGILCDVWSSKLSFPGFRGQNETYVYELYVSNSIRNIDQSSDQVEFFAPIAAYLTNTRNRSNVFVNQFFDFDSKFEPQRYDISQCFSGKDKLRFGIRFRYDNALQNQDNFDSIFKAKTVEPFRHEIRQIFNRSLFDASPLRIIPPRIVSQRDSFTIYSGVVSSGPPIHQFVQSRSSSRVDPDKITKKYSVDSPEKCASLCTDKDSVSALEGVPNFVCRSFDYCRTSDQSRDRFCAFYTTSSSDQNVVLQNGTRCDHYSKTVEKFDSATVNQLYNVIQESVARRELKLQVFVNESAYGTFESTDFFSVDTDVDFTEVGFSSFFNRFVLRSKDLDLDEELINKNKSIILRKLLGISIDECARSCFTESRFDCQIMTYSTADGECKWSSLLYFENQITNSTSYLKPSAGYSIFTKNSLSDYIEYPFKVSSNLNNNLILSVNSPSECAYRCNRETRIKCRSFNYCQDKDSTYKCIPSETNIHNEISNPNIVFTAVCSHYSKKPLSDYQLVPQTQMGVAAQTKLSNASVEFCAEICSREDNYLCRSFDYFTDKRECQLYKENVKDKIYINLGLTQNENADHYSRLYYEKNGQLLDIVAVNPNTQGAKYSGGAIFGILVALIVGGLLIGVLGTFSYFKIAKKNDMLPVMKFVNPNYEKPKE